MKQLWKNSEWRWVLIVSVCVILLSNTPYLYAAFHHPTNKIFTGIHNINPGDTYSYVAWIEQAKEGESLFQDLYTTEKQEVLLFHPVFFSLGLLARIFHLTSIFAYNIARVILGFTLLLLLYKLLTSFISPIKEKRFTFLLLASAGGVGWILHKTDAIEQWMVEAFTFLSLYESVLNLVALIIFVGCLIIVLHDEHHKWKTGVWLGLLISLLTLTHTYDLIVLAPLLGSYYLIKSLYCGKSIIPLIIAAIISLPAVVYQLYVTNHNEALLLWLYTQPQRPAPSIAALFLGLGFFILLGLPHILLRKTQELKKGWVLVLWIAINILALYLPFGFPFQRKLIIGLQIPLVIIGGSGLWLIISKLSESAAKWAKPLLTVMSIIVLTGSNLQVMGKDIRLFSSYERPYFINENEGLAFKWINQNTNKESIVLTGTFFGNLLPGIAGRKVYLGQEDQTIDFENKKQLLAASITCRNKCTGLRDFLYSNHINYLMIDAELRPLASPLLSEQSFLQKTFKNEDITIYKIIHEP